MKKVTLATAKKAPFDLEAFIMHTSPTLEVIHIHLKPGQMIPQHSNPFDVVACLLEGTVLLHTGENEQKIELYDTVEIEKDLDRGFANKGTTDARLLILKKLQ